MNHCGGLYHRQEEWNKLRHAYDTRHQRHLVISVGAAGIGKTALIERCLREEVQKDQGYFVQGRFDEVDHPEPYSPWIDASEQLISAIIQRSSTDDLASIIKSIEKNVDAADLVAFASLIPILGKMMNIMPPKASSNKMPTVGGRFNFMMIFGGFLRGLASLGRPIVWFFDDVHYADASALEVLKLLVADARIPNVLPVVAFRPVSPEHPASTFLMELEASEIELIPIILGSIPEIVIQDWLADSYDNMDLTDPHQQSRICSTIAKQCQGNALAIHLCLEIMNFNREIVKETGGTPLQAGGDARSLLAFFMQMLSSDCRKICMVSSCVGHVVDIPLLTRVVEGCDIYAALKDAERHGILEFRLHDEGCGDLHDVDAGYYAFANPTYRGIIYSMLDPDQRKSYHKAIANVLSDAIDKLTLFRVVVQKALAADLLPPEDKELLIVHCVQAGRFAMQWSEFILAAKYLRLGISLLRYCRPRFWKVEGSLITDLYCDTAEVEVRLGQHLDLEEFLEEAKKQAYNSADRLKVGRLQMQAFIAQAKFREAIDTGIKALLKNGEITRKNATFAKEFIPVRLLVESNSDIVSFPTMGGPKAVVAMEVMNLLVSCAMVHQADLVPVLACRMVKLTYEWGLAWSSPFAFALLGAILCLQGVEVEMGTRISDIALRMVDVMCDSSSRGRVMTMHWGVVGRFIKPWMTCQEPLKVAYLRCIRAGDSEFGMICPVISAMNMIAAGVDELQPISESIKSVYKFLQRKNHDALQRVLRPYYQLMLHLRGVSREVDPAILTGTIMTEEEDMRYIEEHPNPIIEFSLLFCRAWISFHLHIFGKARLLFDRCQAILREKPQVMLAPMQICLEYASATTSARLLWKYKHRSGNLSIAETKRRAFLESSLRSSLDVLQSLGRHCAANAEPQALMVQGEWEALNGQVDAAKDFFQQAIDYCETSHSLADKALFCEHAGLTLRVCSDEDNALDYLEDSCASYRAWGALIKVHHIKSGVIPEAVHEWDE